MAALFHDRHKAGQQVAHRLKAYRGASNTLVLGLPRGGMVPAFEVADYLSLPLDLLMVRKLTLPNAPRSAIGAITSGGHTLLNEEAIEAYGATEAQVHAAELEARTALQIREEAYRGDSPNLTLRDHQVIIVDDGMNSGATMQVAIAAAKIQGPSRIIIAVPVASALSIQSLQHADEVICLHQPEDFIDIDSCYKEFPEVTDDQVRDLLQKAQEFPMRDIDIPPYS